MQQDEPQFPVEPIVLGSLSRPSDIGRDQPCQRQFHSAAVHKGMLYIYGGVPTEEPSDAENEQRCLYRYNCSTKVWSKLATSVTGNYTFSFLAGHSAAFVNNSMMVTGGKNYKTKQYLLGLWAIIVDSSNKATWKRQDVKGYSPGPRQHAALAAHQRSTIILYGGQYLGETLNDCHIYRTDSKIWVVIDEYSYDMRFQSRLKPGFCSLNDHLYLFGGQKSVLVQDEVKYQPLNDFHQIRLLNRPMNSRLDVWVKDIITHSGPSPRVASLVTFSDKVILLWGGDNKMEDEPVRGMWAYYASDYTWHWVKFKVASLPSLNPGCSISPIGDKCFIFGEYSEEPDKKKSGLQILNIDPKQLETKMDSKKNKQPQVPNLECSECSQQLQSLNLKFKDFFLLTESLSDQMEWALSAFGLLVDNTTLLSATDCRVIFHSTFKEKFCLIQDNGNPSLLWQKGSDFISDMLSTKTYVESNIDQLDEFRPEQHTKKTILECEPVVPLPAQGQLPPGQSTVIKENKDLKQLKEKELRDKQQERELRKRKEEAKRAARKRMQERKQYSRNMKLGAMRIGQRALLISRFGANNEHKRVFCLERVEEGEVGSFRYRAYYYLTENNLLPQNSGMEPAKRYIDEEYKALLKISNERKEQGGNMLFITGLRQVAGDNGQMEAELKESQKHSDVFCCDKRQLDTLEDGVLTESLDISLKHYLELLYLKNDEFKIWLELSDRRSVEMSNLEMFDRIDQLVKAHRIIDLEEALDLEQCNIIEAYYNHNHPQNTRPCRDSKHKVTSFQALNGVLLYHKNRLITRHKYPLGQINKIFKGRQKLIAQSLSMFGFIQIKEEYQVNIFKNKFIRQDLLESIYHRLKFVQKYAERATMDDAPTRGGGRRDGQGSPRKRTKPNEDIPKGAQVIELQ